jgi:sugar phosphate isomerase/epimerase
MLRLGAPVFIHGEKKAAETGENHGAAAVDPEALAKAHRAKGYSAAYSPRVKMNQPELVKEVRRAFEAEDVMLAEYGNYKNFWDTDKQTRDRNREEMVEVLAVSEELGVRCAVGIVGSLCHGRVPTEHLEANFAQEMFEEAVDLARFFIDTVKPKTTFFAYEIFPFNVLDSPEMIVTFIHAVDRKQFGVHLDLVNLINCPRAYFTSGNLMKECIRLFGDRIISAHAKDVKLKEPSISVILEEVIPGGGGLDIAANIRELHKLAQTVPFMIEHLKSEEEYDRAAAHIRRVARKEGIDL